MPLQTSTNTIVNTTKPNDQFAPNVAVLSDGRYVIAWDSLEGSPLNGDVRFRIFNSTGTPVSNDVEVSGLASEQIEAAVTGLPGGGFVVTWQSDASGTNDIKARIYNSSGVAVGSEITVNTTTANDQEGATVTRLTNGNFIVSWQSDVNLATNDIDVRAQIFTASGSKVGSEFSLTSVKPEAQAAPSITALADGRFIATWQSYENATSETDIRARFFNANGTPVAADFKVNTLTDEAQLAPVVTQLTGGRVVIAWTSNENNLSDANVRGRIFNANGTAVTTDLTLNDTTTGLQTAPAITALTDNRFMIAYESRDGATYEIRARVIDENGVASGDDFIVNTTTTDEQRTPSLKVLPNGKVVVAWYSSDTGDGSGSTIRSAIVDPYTYNGTSGADQWIGGNRGDRMFGNGGNDTLIGKDGNDSLHGGAGADVLNGGAGFDYASYYLDGAVKTSLDGTYAGANRTGTAVGDTYIFINGLSGSNTGNDELAGDLNNNVLGGNGGNDLLFGRAGNDKLYGGLGTDTLRGEDGNDRILGGAGADVIDGGNGTDLASYYYDGPVKASLDGTYTPAQQTGAAQGDTFISIENLGGSNLGADSIIGNSGANSLYGYAGNDFLSGKNGDDSLFGGLGADTMSGGATGADKFYWYSATEGGDKILDFQAGDRLVFEGSAFGLGTYAGTLNAANFRSVASGHAAGDSNDRFIFDQSTDQLWYDSNGNAAGGATMIVDMNNVNLTNGYLIII